MHAFPSDDKPKIYLFVTGRAGAGWLMGVALAEDGQILGGRLASSREWLRFHMGLSSGQMHQAYRGHYRRGYQLVEVADDEVLGHRGLAEAIRRNRELEAVDND